MPAPVPANALPRKSPWRLHVSSITTLMKRVWTSSYEDGVYNRAAELAYFFFLSLFPGVIFITTLLGFVFKSNTQLTALLLQYLSTTLPGTAFDLIRQVITEITRSSGSGKLTFGILAALWTANSGMNALEDALNAVYKVKESRRLVEDLWHRAHPDRFGIAADHRRTDDLSLWWRTRPVGLRYRRLETGFLLDMENRAVANCALFVSMVASMVYYAAPNLKQRCWQW